MAKSKTERGRFSSKTVREYQLTSQLYNKIESLNGFSQEVIRVSDGSTVYDQPVTILQLTRTDRSREWARRGNLRGRIPFSLPSRDGQEAERECHYSSLSSSYHFSR
jgi:hypothetical protein